MTSGRARAAGAGAALLWLLLCLRWFDVGVSRPRWLTALPPALLALAELALLGVWLRARWPVLAPPPLPGPRGGLLLVVGLAVLFRLPLAWQGAAGYLTPDGALSGIVAQHVREGVERLVFVPHVPYSGSLKSHLTAPLSVVMDTARAFALASVFFYAVFVAALYRLALHLGARPGSAGGHAPNGESVSDRATLRPLQDPKVPLGARLQPGQDGLLSEPAGWTAVAAGLYAAFAPAFVTRYSLSNDGNYVEVLALGTLALALAVRVPREPEHSGPLALATGLLLGLAFWCHILAVIHVAAIGAFLLLADPRAAVRAARRTSACSKCSRS